MQPFPFVSYRYRLYCTALHERRFRGDPYGWVFDCALYLYGGMCEGGGGGEEESLVRSACEGEGGIIRCLSLDWTGWEGEDGLACLLV